MIPGPQLTQEGVGLLLKHCQGCLDVGMVVNKDGFSECGGYAALVNAMLMKPRFYRPYSGIDANCGLVLDKGLGG